MKTFPAKSAVLFSVVLLSMALCRQAQAQLGFSVLSPHIDLELEAGGSRTAQAKVENKTGQTMTIEAAAKDFAHDKNGNLQLLNPDEGKYFNGCASWVSFEKTSKQVAPGKIEEFQFKVRVPKKARTGTYRTYLIFSTVSTEDGSVRVIGEIAALLKIEVQGGGKSSKNAKVPIVIREGKLLFLDHGRLNFGNSIPFAIKLENAGNVGLDTKATIEIRNEKNNLVERIDLPGKNVKADAQQIWEKNWEPRSLFGRYRAVARVDANLEKPLTESREFWVINKWLLLILALLGVGVGVFAVLVLPRLKITRRT